MNQIARAVLNVSELRRVPVDPNDVYIRLMLGAVTLRHSVRPGDFART